MIEKIYLLKEFKIIYEKGIPLEMTLTCFPFDTANKKDKIVLKIFSPKDAVIKEMEKIIKIHIYKKNLHLKFCENNKIYFACLFEKFSRRVLGITSINENNTNLPNWTFVCSIITDLPKTLSYSVYSNYMNHLIISNQANIIDIQTNKIILFLKYKLGSLVLTNDNLKLILFLHEVFYTRILINGEYYSKPLTLDGDTLYISKTNYTNANIIFNLFAFKMNQDNTFSLKLHNELIWKPNFTSKRGEVFLDLFY